MNQTGTKIVGLVFVGMGVGSLIGLVFFSVASNRIMKAKAGPDGKGQCTPEDRLKVLPIGAIFLPIGFFIYGWTAQYHVHWIVPIMSHALIGFGNIVIFMAISMVSCSACFVQRENPRMKLMKYRDRP